MDLLAMIRKNVFNGEFVWGVILPVAFFTVFDQQGKTLEGTFIAGVWSIGVVGVMYAKTKTVNVFAMMAAVFSAIGLVGTYVSKNPTFYMASPIVIDILLAAVFAGSMCMKKPFIMVLAEKSMKKEFPQAWKDNPRFMKSWFYLSLAWTVLSLSQAAIRIVLLYTVPMNVYYAVSSAYGNISTPLMIIFSFWFPGWYWKKGGQK